MFRSNAAFSDFIRVMPDGKTPDAKYHTAEEGGTIISRNADHVGTLSAGEHMPHGCYLRAADHETNSPKPGDNSHVALLVVLLFVGGGLLTITVIKGVDTELKRRKRHE